MVHDDSGWNIPGEMRAIWCHRWRYLSLVSAATVVFQPISWYFLQSHDFQLRSVLSITRFRSGPRKSWNF